jgi:hypothetical protein
MMIAKTIDAILVEKDVENFYRQFLTKKFPDMIFNSPVKCDGYGESAKNNLKILCEFKENKNLNSRINQMCALAQAIYYIKKFEVNGKKLPNVIFIGDRDECFAIHTNDVFKYLGMDFNWNLQPSNASENTELIKMMMNDAQINPFVFSSLKVGECVEKIKNLNEGVKRLIPITPHNITEVFKYFEDKVVGKHNLDTNEMANLFTQLLINPDDNYLHPVSRRKTVVTKTFGEINLKSRESFESFFSHFSRDYSPKQKEHLTAVVDRLVQDVTRRKQGEFFTPAIWVDKAHEYITSVFGENWKEEYVVWDTAWGTGNLTRDYKFKELYCSTLIFADIETANQMGYNPEAKKKFQFDFLNDPYEYLPEGLRRAIESGKKIIVLMNPPYGRTTGEGGRFSSITNGSTLTEVSKKMKFEKISGTDNFYTQFLYQTLKLGVTNICSFTPANFQTGESFKTFREYFTDKLELKNGFIFQASNFADVSDDWAIQFSIYSEGKTENMLSLDVLDLDTNFEIEKIGEKNFYSTDKVESLKKWVYVDNKKIIDFPKLTSPFNIKETKWGCGISEESFATLACNSNSPSKNAQSVYFLNAGLSENVGKIYVNSENFLKSVTIFSVRRLIVGNWLNWYDEYLKPDENNKNLEFFMHDSVVYSLFESKSNQSSLRQITYKNKLWDIKNQFFWMSKEEMINLANQNNYTELYNDARTDSDRHVYNLLFGKQKIYDQLSDEAKDVIDSVTNLVRLSFGMRRDFADDTNHLNSWDAGYAQLKLLWKEFYPEQFNEFRKKYKILEDKMRPMVYELGFLKK